MTLRGFELHGCSCVLRTRLAALVFAVCCAPGLAAELTQYYVPANLAVALRFTALDPASGPIEEQWFLKELTSALQANSGLPLKISGEGTADLSGLRTHLDEAQSQLVFEYVHVARNRVGNEWGETLTIRVAYRLEKLNDIIVIRLQPLQLADFVTRRTPGIAFLPTPALGPVVDLFKDFSAIMQSAPLVELHRTFLVTGQDEAGTSPKGCLEKFDAILGRYGYGRDEERTFDVRRDDVFLVRTAQVSIPLKVVAIRYRGGSKVFYEAWVPFWLRANGTVQGSELAPVLRSEVRRVLEDAPTREADGGTESMLSAGKFRDRR
jgi:hypothetical protein